MAPLSNNDLSQSPRARVVTFNGEAVTVPTDVTDIAGFIREQNRRRGIATFVAVVAGQELNSIDEINSAFEDGNVLEIRTYAKPGTSL